jgi:uncharacterized protein
MSFAAFTHHTSRTGFEVVFLGDRRFEGHTSAVEEGRPFAVRYVIEVDERWHTRRAEVAGRPGGAVLLEADGEGRWLVDGERAPRLDGCLDVDLEASAFTNAFPVARGATDAPAAWVRAFDLSVERLEQSYRQIAERRFDYHSPADDFHSELVFGEDGIVLDYPGIATRWEAR